MTYSYSKTKLATVKGVEFINENGRRPGVRLCKRQRQKKPKQLF
jgi:hypothetical protein